MKKDCSSFKKHKSVIKGEKKLSKRLLKRFNGKIERIFIKIRHFYSVRIWDNKKKIYNEEV